MPFLVQDFDPSGSLIAFSRSCLVEIIHWDEAQGDEVAQIATQTEELEEMVCMYAFLKRPVANDLVVHKYNCPTVLGSLCYGIQNALSGISSNPL